MIFHDYKPKMQKNPLLIGTAVISAAAVAGLWYFREQLELSVPDMLMLTGAALVVILLTIRDILKKMENFRNASALKKQRDKMECEDFSDSSIFFK
ncbi:MAG: hypothetical protein PUI48_10405 [Oscillospiraceae bacterium]|nr:hypothetical protein [Oscillospiraceae bacterium]MDY3793014.1 hypothetical protein [Oscillospiraceae bacterium]MDY6208114.1 hypothetical protein [Oscillospiraceae bacterium]